MTKAKELPSQEYLKTLFDYDAETGLLFRNHLNINEMVAKWGWTEARTKERNTKYTGTPVTCINNKDYIAQRLDGKMIYVHRIIYKIMTGDEPDQIDHINGDPSDNSWVNLRNVSNKVNQQNQKRRSDNTSGHTGVGWHKSRGKWQAMIMVKGKNIHLGFFTDLDEAIAARQAANILYGFHPNHGRKS